MMRHYFSVYRLSKQVLGLTLAGMIALTFIASNGSQAQDLPAEKPPIHVTLLQLNDVYQISPVDKGQRGGLARVATLVKRFEAQNPNTFLLLAGDTLSPSIASKLFQGKQMIDLWNALGLDVATFGNHEFDFGDAVLRKRMQESQFPWLGANVIDQTTGQPFGGAKPYIIKEVDGVKIGFFGLLTPDTTNASHPGPDIEFLDPVMTACATVGKMRQDGVDVIVGLTHLPMFEDKRLAQKMPYRMALIMGGHEHTLLQSVAAGVPIYKVASDAVNLGHAELLIDPETHRLQSLDWEVIPVTADTPDDPSVASLVKDYEDKINTELGQPVGQTTVALDAVQANNRSRETNLGDFIADAYRTGMQADVALANGGSIRSNTTIDPGALTRRDVLTILPFGNMLVKLQVTGRQLKEALENGVSRLGQEEAGRFPQVSGLKFTYDGAKPAGSRVTEVKIADVKLGWTPLNPLKLYTLATTSYVADGGDDYAVFKSAKRLITTEEAPLEADFVIDAILQAKTIAPQTDGRIQRVNERFMHRPPTDLK